MSEKRLSSRISEKQQAKERSIVAYHPPFQMVIDILGIKYMDLSAETMKVSSAGIKYIMIELLKNVLVDEAWYLERYPDVKAAILSGDIESAAEHFRRAGYVEGRLPREFSFDPDYYLRTYQDLSEFFDATDVDGLRDHFLTSGYFEGRAGIREHFADAERWRVGPNATC